ncbi:cysteine proteinase 15A [Selaginella moellendorffii]|uniref:cysteine proteinase 15A n=1 Tax=Selaginella moellendorffii TaxID=88036 RepID=UPI000D1CE233|nr:cysteine proteinase 15A [Selaginella moellendorffii]|eukprot:XP_024528811.1 cysteine proteinase 15A [Selaginella moellendorffii]
MAMGKSALAVLLLSLAIASAAAASSQKFDSGIRQVTDTARDESNGRLDAAKALLDVETHFKSFIARFGKAYATAEAYAHRLKVFEANLVRAVSHQALDPSAVHGITQFSDLTEEEFKQQFLGLRVPSRLREANKAPVLPTNDLPEDFDWREHGAVTEVKNQGACGSCWAFSTTGAIEGAHFLETGKLISLSEQQLVDCDHSCDPTDKVSCDAGCNGGLMTNAYDYVMKSGGLETETDYPYTGNSNGKCQFNANKIVASVANFSTVSLDEDQIAANLVKHGPLAIGINAVFMQTYIGGVSCPIICSKHHIDHGVLLVGYGAKGYAPIRFTEKPYWIIKNSWGATWGEQGYYKICRGHGMCGMNTMVSTVA